MDKNNSSNNDRADSKHESTVLTVRIKKNLDEVLNTIAENRHLTKAAVIREYLEKSEFFLMDHNSIKSLNQNELILLKRRFFNKIISELDEKRQIELATELARFINDLARLKGKMNDIPYKLDLCEEYGLFPKFLDEEGFILINKKFGPKRFVEAFMWILITMGDKGDYDREFTTEEIEDSKKVAERYMETIQPVRRDETHYAFEFARLKNESKG